MVSVSKVVHIATAGGKFGNYKKVTAKKSFSIKVGKTKRIKAKGVPKSKKKKIRIHRIVKYESTNNSIATVSSKGKVKGIRKGTCYVYAYVQNGISKKIKIKVK